MITLKEDGMDMSESEVGPVPIHPKAEATPSTSIDAVLEAEDISTASSVKTEQEPPESVIRQTEPPEAKTTATQTTSPSETPVSSPPAWEMTPTSGPVPFITTTSTIPPAPSPPSPPSPTPSSTPVTTSPLKSLLQSQPSYMFPFPVRPTDYEHVRDVERQRARDERRLQQQRVKEKRALPFRVELRLGEVRELFSELEDAFR